MVEYNYLFAQDINLIDYGLGVISQPKMKDFIDNNIKLEQFYLPFVLNNIIINNSTEIKKIIETKNKLGDLTFLLFNLKDNLELLMLFKKTLSMLYKVEEIDFNVNIKIKNDIIITNENFPILCDTVLDFLQIDKKHFEIKIEPKKEKSELELKFDKLEKQYLEMTKSNKKNKGFGILELCNIIIHSSNFKYEDILNMTVYQIKNSYKILMEKENYIIEQLYKISPKFEIKNNKNKHWTEKTFIK